MKALQQVHAGQSVVRLNLHGTSALPPTEHANLRILAITAGVGNGWHFSAASLRNSLPHWEGVHTFVDHAPPGTPRSLRDLAGVCDAPQWDEEHQGIVLTLRPFGPCAALLQTLAEDWLNSPLPRPRIGFSADLSFRAQRADKEVLEIIKVHSLDLVFDPARGGRLIQQESFSTHTEEPAMEETLSQLEEANEPVSQPALQTLYDWLLEARLQTAHLPAPAAAQLRQQFAGRSFTPQEVDQAIQQMQALSAALQGPVREVSGRPAAQRPDGELSGMITGEERLQAAVDDLLGAPRDPALRAAQVERLSGLRELYTLLTGDVELRGQPQPERTRLATTATLPGLVKNAMNKMIVQTWEELGRAGYQWWRPLVTVEHFDSLNDISGVLVGEIQALPAVAEGNDYPELSLNDSTEVGTWVKYGGYLPLTLELIDRDDIFRLRQYPRKLANAAVRNLSGLIAGVFSANGGIGPTLADGGALFNSTPVTTPGGHANLRNAALSAAEWEAASQAVYNQPILSEGGLGPRLALDPKYLLVPRELRLTAMRILYPAFEREANFFSENMQRGEFGDVITVPEWTNATQWAAACDPRLAPAIVVGERFGLLPEIFIAGDENSPALFAADEVRLKVRHFLSVFVADYRPLHKSNPT
ncbi:MAG: hypothetical protein LDL12_08280 [Anaerolinea sp.]|nr:hypothetical protein [Anaerolinea sp.]